MESPAEIAMIGSGNFGTAVAKLLAENNPKSIVQMWVFEEMVQVPKDPKNPEGEKVERKLTEVINEIHENVKYLPGIKLPNNVVANPDVVATSKCSKHIVFCLPHRFLPNIIKQIKPHVPKDAMAITLIKGFYMKQNAQNKKEFVILSDWIEELFEIPCACMFGANIASEVAKGDFAESTIAYKPGNWHTDPETCANMWRKLFHTPKQFDVRVVRDTASAHVCAALKNIIALGCGFVDGLGMGGNTKSAILRKGLIEMIRFSEMFFGGAEGKVNIQIFFESCGIADLVTTCFGGRNRKCAEIFVKHPEKTFLEIEKDELNGQKLEGLATLHEIVELLEDHGKLNQFPLIEKIFEISERKVPASEIFAAFTGEN